VTHVKISLTHPIAPLVSLFSRLFERLALQKDSIEISIEFLHRKLAYGAPEEFSIELLWRIPLELHRNSVELHMPIFCGEILWRFLWNLSVGDEPHHKHTSNLT
jgi:hypothetical protein